MRSFVVILASFAALAVCHARVITVDDDAPTDFDNIQPAIDEGKEKNFKYCYLHDRLGSVRLVIDDQSAVKNTYTYEPFGEMLATECTETIENPFKFTGQYFDSEIEEYYLRARQYNPHIGRFTSRDPVQGRFKEPLTLHKYLYCGNDPLNQTDASGRISISEVSTSIAIGAVIGAVSSIPQALWSGDSRDILVGAAGGAIGGFVTPWFAGYGIIAQGFGAMMASSANTIAQENINRAWLKKESEHFMANLLTSAGLGFVGGTVMGPVAESFSLRDALLRYGLKGDAVSQAMVTNAPIYLNAIGIEASWISEIIWQGARGEWDPR